MKRPRYPSDYRKWFRLPSRNLPDDTAHLTDAQFRAWVLIQQYAHENHAHLNDDCIQIARSRLPTLAPNRRESVATATRVIRELSASVAWEIREEGTRWTIWVRNHAQNQGFAPTELRRDSVKIPNKEKEKEKEKKPHMSASADRCEKPTIGKEAIELAELLAHNVLARFPGSKIPPKRIATWARQIEKIELEPAEIREKLEWLNGPNLESRCVVEVRSGGALRTKLEDGTIEAAIQRHERDRPSSPPEPELPSWVAPRLNDSMTPEQKAELNAKYREAQRQADAELEASEEALKRAH